MKSGKRMEEGEGKELGREGKGTRGGTEEGTQLRVWYGKEVEIVKDS